MPLKGMYMSLVLIFLCIQYKSTFKYMNIEEESNVKPKETLVEESSILVLYIAQQNIKKKQRCIITDYVQINGVAKTKVI